jgi:hypothetical protein
VLECMFSGTCVLAMLAGLFGILDVTLWSKRIIVMNWYFCGNVMR